MDEGTTREPTFSVRLYRPGDEHEIQRMYNAVFDRSRSLAEWRWRFLRAPDGPALIHVLESNGRLAGHLAHVPGRVRVDGAERRIGFGCDMMVAPELRSRGGMRSLVDAFLSSAHGFDVRMNFPNERAAELMQRYGGGRVLGSIQQWTRWAERGTSLPAPARLALTGSTRLRARIATLRPPALAVEDLREPGAEVDELARDAGAFCRCIRIRDSAYIRWRWLEHPMRSWRVRAVRTGSGLRGYAVSGPAEEAYGRIGLVVDLLARDEAATRALLLDAFDALAAEGCASVVCDCLDPRPWAKRAMSRAGFVPRQHGPRVLAGALSDSVGSAPEGLASWYLTLGDTDMV
jgi:Acetyltransferase (GNAT) domain